jgi:5-hydroxyisourate hydrolase-like protein (transthyretin family)
LLRSVNKMVLLKTVLLLALAPWAAAQQANQAAPDAWRITGKVVDALSGAPLARCSVEIGPTEDRGASRSIETGNDGVFAFDGLAQGKYRLSASKRGYLPQDYEQHDNFSTAIAVGPGLQSEGLNFKVVPQAVITGVVTEEHGEPVRRAQVRLFKDQDRLGIRSTVQRQTTATDDRGVYQLARIDPGNYYLAVSGQPWYAQALRHSLPNEKEEEPASPLDVAYPTTFYPQATDSEDATPIPIRGGERIQADVTLNAQPALHVRIRLPVQDQESGFGLRMSQSIFGQVEPVSSFGQTVQNGVMEISGILPGHYDFTLFHPGPGDPTAESTHFTGEVTSSTTELTPGDAESEVTVTGKVTSVDGKIPSGGITLRPHQGRTYTAMLDKAGEFDVKVPPGDYEIVGQIPQMYLTQLTAQDGVVKNRVLTVKAGSTPKLELIASKGFGQIDGVAKRGDQPASGIMVLLAPDDNPVLFRRDQSDSDGSFTLGNVVPGHYRLLAVERGWELEWANRDVLNAFLKKSVPVEVRADDKLTRTVEVQSR